MKFTQGEKSFISLLLVMVLVLLPITLAAAKAAPLKSTKVVPNGYVCLTIDDGWDGVLLKKELDILRARNIHCTFFIIGKMLTRYPDLWKQCIADGNEICYHTMNHTNCTRMSNKKIVADLNKWIATAKSVLGKDYQVPKFVRLPGGSSNQRVLALFKSLGYTVMTWSADTLTGATNKHKSIVKYIKSATKVGTVILTHVNSNDAKALPQYIDWLNAHFKLCRISDAFAPPAPATTPTPPATPTPTPEDTATAGDTATISPTATSSPDSTVTDSPAATPDESATTSPEATAVPDDTSEG